MLLLKHNNCLVCMEKLIVFVLDIQVPVCLKEVSIHSCNTCKMLYHLTFYIFKNDLPKIIDFKTHKQIK